jgi:hypothetical protein
MKTIFIIIISSLLLSSCYTKKQAINKFCKQDTINTFVTLHDTIRTETIQIDTAFSDRVDSIVVQHDKMVIKYIHKNGKIYLDGKYKGDTIYINKEVRVAVPVTIPKCEIPWYQKYWYVFAALALFSLLIFWIKR